MRLSTIAARAATLLLASIAVGCAAGCAARLDVPVPAVSAAPAPLPPLEPASIALPITVSLASLRAQLEAQLPPFDSLGQAQCAALGGAVCHQYVYRRDTLALDMRATRIDILARVRYRGRIAVPGVGGIGSCGYAPEAMRRAELRFATNLFWRDDWRVGSRLTSVAVHPVDACEVTALRVDATPLMKRIIDGQARRLTQQIDATLPTLLDLRPAADSLWRSMQEPTALDTTNTAWLVMSPEKVQLAPLAGRGGQMSTALLLTARPRVVLGAKPASVIAPLPPLALTPPVSGLHVPVQIELPFADLSDAVTRTLAGETAGQGLTVNGAKVWAVGDTAVVKLDLTGKVTGALYLLGRFAYDSATRSVLVSDLRYTLASAGALTRMKATLGAPLIRRALDEATGRGAFDVGAQLDSMRSMLTREMNRTLSPGVQLEGEVRDITIRGLYATPTSFVLRVVLDGSARAIVR